MKRWWQVPALLTPFPFSSLSHSRCIGSLWVQLICSEYLYRLPGPSPVLWDGGGETALFFFFRTFQKLPFYSYFGETPWGSSHIEAGSAQSQAQLSTAQPHPKSRCHGSCPHICSACPPQKKKRVSVEVVVMCFDVRWAWKSYAIPSWMVDGSNRPRPRNAGLRWSCWRSSPLPFHPRGDDTQTINDHHFGWFSQVRYVSSPVSKRFLELLLQYLCDAEIIHPPNQRLNRSLNFTTMLQIHPSLS